MNDEKANACESPINVEADQERRSVVPVYEEKLNAGVKKVKTGGVRIHKTVEQHQEIIDQPLATEDVEVVRVVKNEVVSGPMANRQSGDTLIIPVVKEMLKVEKQWVLTEELHITKRRSETRSRQPVTIRRENVEIERTDAEGHSVPSESKVSERKTPRVTPSILGECDSPRPQTVRKTRFIK